MKPSAPSIRPQGRRIVPSNLQPNCGCYMGQCLLIDFTCGRTVVTVQVDCVIGVAKGRNRLPGLTAVLGAIARHEVDVIVDQSLLHLGNSVDSLLETLAELHRHGVKLIVHDHAGAVETGGLLAAADLLVEAPAGISTREHRGMSVEGVGEWCSIRSPTRATQSSGEGADGSAIRPGRAPSGSFQWGHRTQGVEDQCRDGCRRAVDLTNLWPLICPRPTVSRLQPAVCG